MNILQNVAPLKYFALKMTKISLKIFAIAISFKYSTKLATKKVQNGNSNKIKTSEK